MTPDISICIITYQHEPYIRETLDSIAMQQFSGSIEVIIGIDVSADRTRELVYECTRDYKWAVTIRDGEARKGMFGNLLDVYTVARGRYLAMLEGDDYWIDPLKLQKQFDYLESHPQCVAAGGGIMKRSGDTLLSEKAWHNAVSRYYFLNDFVHANRSPFCTAFFRREALSLQQMELLRQSPHLDWPIYMILFSQKPQSYFKVFADVFSVYRIHAGGVFNGVSDQKRQQNILKTMEFNELITGTEDSAHYYRLYKTYAQNPGLPCPAPAQLLREGMPKDALLSFYLYNFGKEAIVKALLKNAWLLPMISWQLCKKLAKRYLKKRH